MAGGIAVLLQPWIQLTNQKQIRSFCDFYTLPSPPFLERRKSLNNANLADDGDSVLWEPLLRPGLATSRTANLPFLGAVGYYFKCLHFS